MKIPKYVIDLMSRAKYNYNYKKFNNNYEVGYTIDIAKYSHFQTVDTFSKEIDKLKKWVEKQKGGEMIILQKPIKTKHKTMQYATVTIFDPVMKRIEKYIKN